MAHFLSSGVGVAETEFITTTMMSKLSHFDVAAVAVLSDDVVSKINLDNLFLMPLENVQGKLDDETPVFVEYSHDNWGRIYDMLTHADCDHDHSVDLCKPVYFEFRAYYGFPLGPWDCENSPWDHCVYYDHVDPAHDFCLYCGGPEERK